MHGFKASALCLSWCLLCADPLFPGSRPGLRVTELVNVRMGAGEGALSLHPHRAQNRAQNRRGATEDPAPALPGAHIWTGPLDSGEVKRLLILL